MLHPYKRSDMVYEDYEWSAGADADDPKIIGGNDHTELNRSDGDEMICFIGSLAKTWHWESYSKFSYPLGWYQELEKTIREKVPATIRTHSGIKDWIADHYQQLREQKDVKP